MTVVGCSLGISPSTTNSFHPQSNGIIEHFHRSLKTVLHVRLAGLDWFLHLPLVLLGLWSVPKENTRFSVSVAVFGSPLAVPGEFLKGGEFPFSRFLQKIEQAVSGFAGPPSHHVCPAPPAPLPPALLAAKFVFVREVASGPSLAPLYRGPYLVLEWHTKFFHLQLGDKTDVVFVDKLKPAFSDEPFSDEPISLALPPIRGRPALNMIPVP